MLTNTPRKHVLNDLQPYICTYPDYSHSNHPFESQDAWHRHESQLHRFEFFCNTPEHPSFLHPVEFDLHLREKHQETLDATGVPLDLFKRPQPPYGTCNICFRKSENLRRHVSRHLQQVSLFALPRADYGAGDEDLKESDSDMAQRLTKRSKSLDMEGESIEGSEDSSCSSRTGPISLLGPVSELVETSFPVDDVQQSLIPDTDEMNWDLLTDKFSMVREGNSENAPIFSKNRPMLKTVALALIACLRLGKSLGLGVTSATHLPVSIPNYDRVKMVILDVDVPEGRRSHRERVICHCFPF